MSRCGMQAKNVRYDSLEMIIARNVKADRLIYALSWHEKVLIDIY